VPLSIQTLFDVTSEAYGRYDDPAKFRDVPPGQSPALRRRLLAIGSWNAPAYTNWLAGVRPWATPSPQARALLEDYMLDASVYLRNT
jgi:hypothetical protein